MSEGDAGADVVDGHAEPAGRAGDGGREPGLRIYRPRRAPIPRESHGIPGRAYRDAPPGPRTADRSERRQHPREVPGGPIECESPAVVVDRQAERRADARDV